MFKVGDKVKVIRNGSASCNSIGDVGIITEINESFAMVTVDGKVNFGNFSKTEELVLVKDEPMFKVGDKVSKKSGDTFSNGKKVVTIREYAYGGDSTVWLKETGTTMGISQLVKVEQMEYEDQWHLNDGKVTIPDDADKLEKDGSVVAFRKVKVPVFNFGDKVDYCGDTYLIIKNTEEGWCWAIKETSQCCTTLQRKKLTRK